MSFSSCKFVKLRLNGLSIFLSLMMDSKGRGSWVRRESKSRPGKIYYFNTKTRLSRWTSPYEEEGEAEPVSITSGKRKDDSQLAEPKRKLARSNQSVDHVFKPSSNIKSSNEIEDATLVQHNTEGAVSTKAAHHVASIESSVSGQSVSGPVSHRVTCGKLVHHDTSRDSTTKRNKRKKRKRSNGSNVVPKTNKNECNLVSEANRNESNVMPKATVVSEANKNKSDVFPESVVSSSSCAIYTGNRQEISSSTICTEHKQKSSTEHGEQPISSESLTRSTKAANIDTKVNRAELRLERLRKDLSKQKEEESSHSFVPLKIVRSSQTSLKVSATNVFESSVPSKSLQTSWSTTFPVNSEKTPSPDICQSLPSDCSRKHVPSRDFAGVRGPAESRLQKLQQELALNRKNVLRSEQRKISHPEPTQPQHPFNPLSGFKNIKGMTNAVEVGSAVCPNMNNVEIPYHEENLEAMEVDVPECNVLNDINELRKTDFSKVNSQPFFVDVDMEVEILPSDNKTFCVVLDTNVLLSNLKIVQGLRDTVFPGKGSVTLYLPWQVIQELDSIKDHGKSNLKPLARQAVNFLHDNFSSKHPRVRGQKYCDVKKNDFDCPDDSILQACLDLRDQGCNVILFSNDKNLCNKALLNEVPTASKDEIVKLLSEQRQSSASAIINKPCTSESNSLHQNNIVLNESASKLSDSVLCELKMNINKFISEIVSTGMEKEYGDLWRKRTIVPPPWEACDALKCLSQHWLPISGESGGKLMRLKADQLVEFFLVKTKRYGVVMTDVQDAIKITLELFDSLRHKYSTITTVGKKQLEELLKRSKKCDTSSEKENLPGKVGSSPDVIVNSPNLPCETPTIDRSVTVLLCFERAYNTVADICHMKSQAPLDLALRQKANEVLNAVRQLIQCMVSLLSASESVLNEESPAARTLLLLIKGQSDITEKDIIDFCRTKSTKTLLENGLKQFQDFERSLGSSCGV